MFQESLDQRTPFVRFPGQSRKRSQPGWLIAILVAVVVIVVICAAAHHVNCSQCESIAEEQCADKGGVASANCTTTGCARLKNACAIVCNDDLQQSQSQVQLVD